MPLAQQAACRERCDIGGTCKLFVCSLELESARDFFERARLTYRDRAGKAKDPASAKLQLAAFEKVAVAIQTLRKEEPNKMPGPDGGTAK